MFPVRYVSVAVALGASQSHRYMVRAHEAQEFAAERRSHFAHDLGAYTGSRRLVAHVVDTFERGTITIEN